MLNYAMGIRFTLRGLEKHGAGYWVDPWLKIFKIIPCATSAFFSLLIQMTYLLGTKTSWLKLTDAIFQLQANVNHKKCLPMRRSFPGTLHLLILPLHLTIFCEAKDLQCEY